MDSKDIYRKKFEEMLRVEEKARDLYKYYLSRIEDSSILEKFKELHEDEERHVNIVKGFIDKTY